MPVGEDQFVTLALDHVGYQVPKGHRLRVSISTAYWPLMWPTPTAAAVHIHRAQLGVPLHEARAQDGSVAFPPPAAAEPWEVEELRPETHVRRQDTDMVTGTTTLVIEDDFGKWRDSDHGLINGSVARERWSIHPDDPLSARGTCHWTDEIERGDIRLRTETYSEMWSDGTTFYLTAKVEAYENDTLIFDKSVEDSIARDHL